MHFFCFNLFWALVTPGGSLFRTLSCLSRYDIAQKYMKPDLAVFYEAAIEESVERVQGEGLGGLFLAFFVSKCKAEFEHRGNFLGRKEL